MKKTTFLILILLSLFAVNYTNAQGKLLAVGGGTEQNTDNSWNSKAYKWAVDNAANGKIAIIGTADDSGWLSDYFVNKLGAVQATYFKISSTTQANNEDNYNAIVECDMIFLKGGDQFKYYTYYRDSRIEDAIIEIYNRGGVIAGTSAGAAILSKVIFSADKGTVYPEEALQDPFNQYMNLNDDFLPFLDGFLIDTHFAERGRFGRMFGFLGNWYIERKELISGIGIDDQTAFAIDENLIGTAFGTGAVNVFMPDENTNFRLSSGKLMLDQLNTFQLLDGYSIDLKNIEAPVYSKDITPSSFSLNNNYDVTLTASNNLSDISEPIDYFLNKCESVEDTIYLISSMTDITEIKEFIEGRSAHRLFNIDLGAINVDSDSISKQILQQKNFIVYNVLNSEFLRTNEGIVGRNIQYQLKSNNANVLLIGSSAGLAGTSYVYNYDRQGFANSGRLKISDAYDLLKNYTIQPEVFTDPDVNENSAVSVPYTMVSDNLQTGIWLGEATWISFERSNGQIMLSSSNNDFPVILIENNDSTGDFSTTSEYGDGDKARNLAGFSNMSYKLIDNTSEEIVGDMIKISPEIINLKHTKSKLENTYKFEISFDILNKQNLEEVNVFWGEEINTLNNKAEILESSGSYTLNFEIDESVEKIYIKYQLISHGETQDFYRIKNVNEALSLPDLEELGVKIYPNPVTDELMLEYNVYYSDLSYDIYTLEGKKVNSGNVKQNRIEVSSLAKGNYLLILQIDNKSGIKKFIKE